MLGNFTCTFDHIRANGAKLRTEQKVREGCLTPLLLLHEEKHSDVISRFYFTPISAGSFPVHARSRSETEYCEYVPLRSFFPYFMRLLIRPMESKLFPGNIRRAEIYGCISKTPAVTEVPPRPPPPFPLDQPCNVELPSSVCRQRDRVVGVFGVRWSISRRQLDVSRT